MCFPEISRPKIFEKKFIAPGFFIHNPVEKNSIALKFRPRFISERTRFSRQIFHAINRTNDRD
jgi:hypothetical protein